MFRGHRSLDLDEICSTGVSNAAGMNFQIFRVLQLSCCTATPPHPSTWYFAIFFLSAMFPALQTVPAIQIGTSRLDLFIWRLKSRSDALPDFPHFANVLLHRDATTPLYVGLGNFLPLGHVSRFATCSCNTDLDEICSSGVSNAARMHLQISRILQTYSCNRPNVGERLQNAGGVVQHRDVQRWRFPL